MFDDQVIKGKIRLFILNNFIFDERANLLGDDDSFLDEGIIDSTGVLELLAFVEETFGMEVADEDVLPENFDTLNNLANYVSSRTLSLPLTL